MLRTKPWDILLKNICLLIALGTGFQQVAAQASYYSQLNAHKWDVQPHDYSPHASNIISFQNYHLAFFCQKDFQYRLYRSDTQSKNWIYFPSPHEGKRVIADFIQTDSNIFFFAWGGTFMYEYIIPKFDAPRVTVVDSFEIKNGEFTTFWTFADPKSKFFVISIGLTKVDSTCFYAANERGLQIIRKTEGAPWWLVNRDPGLLIDNYFILWDYDNYKIYNYSGLIDSVSTYFNKIGDILSVRALVFNDTIAIGSESSASNILGDLIYIDRKSRKEISNCKIVENDNTASYFGNKATDSCIYWFQNSIDHLQVLKKDHSNNKREIHNFDLDSKTIGAYFFVKDFFVINYVVNSTRFIDFIDLKRNVIFKHIRHPSSKEVVSVEFSDCNGYFIFTQGQGGGRIGGFYYFNPSKDSTFLIEEFEHTAFTMPLGDLPQVYPEHKRLYYYSEQSTAWFTMAYYDLYDLCKKVHSRDENVVYPNPAHNLLYLTTDQQTVIVYNSIGQLIKRNVNTQWNSEQYIDVSDLADGVYFLIVNNKAHRFIKY